MTKPPPSCCRQVLAAHVLSEGLLAEMPCSACTTSRSLCLFSLYSLKCVDCVHCSVHCDSNFLVDDFNYLTIEQKKLKVAWDAILKRLL
jgi:Zn ribbon nucleic-acid-binding protein